MAYWRTIKLREVINFRKQFITINDAENYKLCRVQTKAKGVVLREVKLGTDIKTKSQQVCRTNDLIFAEMDARFGGYGIIPEELEGAVVSSHYFLYEIDQEKIDKQFLEYCLQMPWFQNQVVAKGSTNYAAIRPYQVLDYEIPYPSPSDQQQIISKIEAVHERIEQIQLLRIEQNNEIRSLLLKAFENTTKTCKWQELKVVAPITRRKVELRADELYNELGVRSFGKGLFTKPSFLGSSLSWQQPYWMKKGDLLFSNIKAWEGAVAEITEEYDGCVGSHRYITCEPYDNLVKTEFLLFYFLTQQGIDELNHASPGSADRNRTLNTKVLSKILVPTPSIKAQESFLELKQKLTSAQIYHQETIDELNGLLPSLLDKVFKGGLTGIDITERSGRSAITAEPEVQQETALNPAHDIFYIRAAVDAYILGYLKGDPHLHRTKMEKVTHLIEYHCQVNLQRNPVRDAAGPSDYSSRLKVENVAGKKGFYTTQTTIQQNGFKEISYTLLDSLSTNVEVAEEYFGDKIDEINIFLNLIKPLNTKQSEVVATLYGSWNDFLINGKQPTDNEIIQDVRNNWDIKKKRIPQPLWDWGLNWMRVNSIIPKGTGKLLLHKLKQA